MVDNPTTAEQGKPRHRWFQFRLRTLLVGVVLLSIPCAYLGHEAAIVAARKEWLVRHEQMFLGGGSTFVIPAPQSQPAALPLIRRLLGDEPQNWIAVSNPDDLKQAKELFPEAEIVVYAPH